VRLDRSDERKALEKARAVLGALTPATARNDEIEFTLRYAYRVVTEAVGQGFAGDVALNDLRSDVVGSLHVVTGSLVARTLMQDRIEYARNSIAALLAALHTQG
jgi:hypothetical protein